MEICIISVGKISSSWIEEGVELYEQRISRYISYSSITIPDVKNSKNLTIEKIKEEEGKAILGKLASSDFVVLSDEKGHEYTSREFAEWIQKQMNTGRKRLVMVIGGPFGFSKEVYQRSDQKISLSRMTLTHEMARLMLTEQTYRAMTILRGEPYHHD